MSTEATTAAPRRKNRFLSISKKILLAFVILIALLAAIIAMQPAGYTVTRSLAINAPPEKIFPHVNDFHNWNDWSPWAKLDPNMQTSFEGPPAGKDAIYKWIGNDKVGEGKMTIADSHPSDTIKIKLEFQRPFKDTADTLFTFKPQNQQATQTLVTWSMSGKKNFIGKAFALVVNMDNLIGADFEKGLAQLKTTAESRPAPTQK